MKALSCGFALVLILSLFPLGARAALGGSVSSVETDRAQMKGTLEVHPASVYSVHQIQAANRTTIREYVSPAGVVFAVGWQGQFMPDMQQLLGAYFQQYSEAVKEQKSHYVGRRPLDLQLPGLVVQMTGHMRGYAGRAYIPEQIPQGVKAEDLW